MSTPTLDTMATEQLDLHFRQLEDRLTHDYSGITRSALHDLVEHERSRFAGARIHAFVPILVERAVRLTLTLPQAKHRKP
ncbi:hypothetical protein GCM10027598_19090 [Amycolatopsis oliviviridis]|uniref:Uncharacterized protein n=1 Tax=Amycolatopsis oliviviridis TaxID=1471590 RepID=A0ABQ3LEP5_9PSEU|nr:hypothetical protein [Amycolatopsis oliviviridis]GHH13951.1 hypothetical protein GCM10017790_26740 [Amycolatopsis oliviviridis]